MDNNTLNHLALGSKQYNGYFEYSKNMVCIPLISSSLLYANAPCYITFQLIKDTSTFTYTKGTATYSITPMSTKLTMYNYYHDVRQALGNTISCEILYDTTNYGGTSKHKMDNIFRTQLPSLDISPFSTSDIFQLLYNPFEFSSVGFPVIDVALGSFKSSDATDTITRNHKISVWVTPLENNDNFNFYYYDKKGHTVSLNTIPASGVLSGLINEYSSGALEANNDRLTLYYTTGSKTRLSSFYENYISGHFA